MAVHVPLILSVVMSSIANAPDAESKLMAMWLKWLQHEQNISAVSRVQTNMRNAVFFDGSDDDPYKKLTISVDQEPNAIWLTPLDHKHLARSDKSVPFLYAIWRYWSSEALASDKEAYHCRWKHLTRVTQYERKIETSRKRRLAEAAVAHAREELAIQGASSKNGSHTRRRGVTRVRR